ncbi:hypothetical protein [Ideonella sp.]|uniref:hypothetical protein n=1 Tax=Ideonella sp. TaxID=1929293 RepID=UPI0035B252FA
MKKTPAFAAHPFRALALGLIGTTCLATHVQALPTYECQLLRPVDGVPADSYPEAINRRGDVIGSFEESPRAWDSTNKGRALTLEPGSGLYTMGGINDDGYAVGSAIYANGSNGSNRGVSYLWAPDGSYQRLSQHEGQITGVSGINSAGVIAGWTQLYNGPDTATLWEDGQQRTLKPLQSGKSAQAIQINDKGVVVGQAERTVDGVLVTHAVRWRDGRVRDLGALPGHKFSTALALNTFGVIVGYSREDVDVGLTQPVAWVNGVMQSLISDQSGGLARSVNKHGEIVGYTQWFGNTRAAYWPHAGAEPVAVESLIDWRYPCRSADGQRATLSMATAINAGGVVVAYGSVSGNYPPIPFRLVPMTKP